MQSQAEAANLERISGRLAELSGALRDRLVRNITELVRIPSENTPPVGAELECQRHISMHLAQLDLKAELYEPQQVEGLQDHPVFKAGRDGVV